MFIDRVKVRLEAGKGGNGVVAWRREKYIPKGGPCGGNGGKGGSVIIVADEQIYSLDWYRHKRVLKADKGKDGGTNLRQGGKGKDLELKVPCGTLIKDKETGEVLHDLTESGQRVVLCQGGRGGIGNNHFKTPTRQAPNFATPGKEGESSEIELELKLIADVGLVGYPNAGKSTLLSALADVKVKTGAYPFTTLHPNLGFIQYQDFHRVYLADIPGIIEGAHDNKGLGLEFLRHIERTRLLIFVLDASGIDGRTPADDYRVLREELAKYDTELLQKPYFVVLNKTDAEESKDHIEDFTRHFPEENPFQTCAELGEGVQPIRDQLKSFSLDDENSQSVVGY